MTFDILCRMIDDIVSVSGEELKKAVVMLFETTHQVAGGAGAASMTGAFKLREQIRGKRVAIPLTGGNLKINNLRAILEEESF